MPNAWRADRDQTERMPAVVVDGGVGQWAAAWPVPAPSLDWPFQFFLDSRAKVSDFLLWFAERRGSFAPFWMPTWRRDFQLVSGAAASDTGLVVYATGYPSAGFLRESRRHLAAIVAGGGGYPIYPRRITAAVDNGDGTETLTIDSALGVDVDRHAVLSFLVLVRLADDEATVQWHHPNLAEALVHTVELRRQMEAVA